MTAVTVYSKNNCVQCTATTRRLDQENIAYDVVKIDEGTPESNAAYDYVSRHLNFRQAPVVEVGERGASEPGQENTWAGYMPDRISRIPEMLAAMETSPEPN